MNSSKYSKISAEEVPSERSTCGFRQRLFKKDDGTPISITRLKTYDATPHWHRHTHEYYYVLQGTGRVIVDGEVVMVQAGDCLWIKPGASHHAEGDLESLIIAVPAYDPEDTFFDTPGEPQP